MLNYLKSDTLKMYVSITISISVMIMDLGPWKSFAEQMLFSMSMFVCFDQRDLLSLNLIHSEQ